MILTLDDFKKITQGAESIVSSDNGFEFIRFNEEEQELYSRSTLKSRTLSPAGIQLCFKTDGDRINISLNTENCLDRSFFCLEVMCNGVRLGSIKNFKDEEMTGFYSWSKYTLGDYSGSFDVSEGEKEIRIVLPWSVRTYIKEMEIENATYICPVKKEKTMLIYGDSITHGYDSCYPSKAYSVGLAHELGAECFIKAVGGEKFWPELAQIKHDIKPDYVTVAYGTNDWSGSAKEVFEENSKKFLENLSKNYKGSKVFVLTPIWRKDYTEGSKNFDGDIHSVEKWLSGVCEEFDNVVCIRGWDLVPHEENYFGDLRLHPNDSGFEHYAVNLAKEIKNYI